MINPIITLY